MPLQKQELDYRHRPANCWYMLILWVTMTETPISVGMKHLVESLGIYHCQLESLRSRSGYIMKVFSMECPIWFLILGSSGDGPWGSLFIRAFKEVLSLGLGKCLIKDDQRSKCHVLWFFALYWYWELPWSLSFPWCLQTQELQKVSEGLRMTSNELCKNVPTPQRNSM